MSWDTMSLLGVGRHFAGVGRLRRALLLLAAAACTAAALLYWRQQSDESARRPLHAVYTGGEPQWSWICRNDRCERMLASETSTLQSLVTCNMLCASTQLWPQPTGPVSLATGAVPLRAEFIGLHVVASPSPDVTEHLNQAFALTKEEMRNLERSVSSSRRDDAGAARVMRVRVFVNGSGDPRLRLDTDESYKLSLGLDRQELIANITAQSFCGARHGFETLSQLVWADPYTGSLLILTAATVEDAPRFKFRGFLLDTARNFFPVSELLRTIDAMGENKLNTFHWHASDSQAFPLQLQSAPQLAAHGAYGAGAVYTTDEIRAVVRRARLRGIRVLLEVDTPAHVGRAWSWGTSAGLGQLAYCVEAEPWSVYCGEPPCGQLNPKNPHVYNLLEKIYAEIITLTGVDDIFHLGGDEVSERCWSQHFNDSDPMELWLEFTRRAFKALERANGGKAPELTLLWSSRLTRSPYLERLDSKRIGVQVWGASRWPESRAVLDAGFRSIISHVDAWYLDCGFGSWRDSSDGHCGPYRSWQQVYEHRPWTEEGGVSSAGEPVLPWRIDGGAACQWTEQLGPGGLDARVWPRTAALAERLWSDRGAGAEADVYLRLDTQRSRMVARGVNAAPLWPRWCTQNPHACL
ncbi:probable beta-hexosaminidase fdl [Leguminivora glycinivorella]|uniref:probable beta-hexosaminidase fdl n=1 Tax=Leguminivora glycinivorella TaxID=1035111 RepID=UPI002010904E|nr:probable beta-hexosaminidase fdl [Leguminivora glycinivorella]XP_047996872.1 probable beta-hexosaminidase fdl [Leguminivora glycinivorella]XP_047996873.1 probable beta-hexosaminidase fdl [Leguminivora glycinivorella]XP_047996874.1 probable beta-hexosaminidase fdl [Leguminivora glycinivorella]